MRLVVADDLADEVVRDGGEIRLELFDERLELGTVDRRAVRLDDDELIRAGPSMRASRSSSARFASGSLVKFASVVMSAGNMPEIAPATTKISAQTATIFHGLRVASAARRPVKPRGLSVIVFFILAVLCIE
ncbi:MAG: hypothetical protein R3A46_03930 [Thermomicrobiales bacterium]